MKKSLCILQVVKPVAFSVTVQIVAALNAKKCSLVELDKRITQVSIDSNGYTALHRIDAASGCRYSILTTLSYFDPTQMLAIDPMHTLFLCVAKYYLQNVWIKKNLKYKTKLIGLKFLQV